MALTATIAHSQRAGAECPEVFIIVHRGLPRENRLVLDLLRSLMAMMLASLMQSAECARQVLDSLRPVLQAFVERLTKTEKDKQPVGDGSTEMQ